MPSTEPRLIGGLEVWLTGTRAQIEQALAGLRSVMGVAPMFQPRPLVGADAGRFHMYVRGFPRGAVPSQQEDRSENTLANPPA